MLKNNHGRHLTEPQKQAVAILNKAHSITHNNDWVTVETIAGTEAITLPNAAYQDAEDYREAHIGMMSAYTDRRNV